LSVEDKVREASSLLREAYSESECKWCSRNLEQLADIADKLAVVIPYTAKTAEEVRTRSDEEIKALGGKIGVLERVVERARASSADNATSPEQALYIAQGDFLSRGLSMDKATMVSIFAGSLTLGAGAGFVLDQLDANFSLGATWYMRIGPIINIVGGAALLYMGYKGKLFKSEKMRMFAVAGGSAMLSNGILKLVERGLSSTGMAPGAMMGRAFVNARAPGQLPMRVVDTTKSY
jgi:hypothetical protein